MTKEFEGYYIYKSDSYEELEGIVNQAIEESEARNVTERPQGGVCAVTDASGKTTFYQAAVCEKERKAKFDF